MFQNSVSALVFGLNTLLAATVITLALPWHEYVTHHCATCSQSKVLITDIFDEDSEVIVL